MLKDSLDLIRRGAARVPRGAHTIDILVRADGQETRVEGDWTKYVRDLFEEPAECNVGDKAAPLHLWECPACVARFVAERDRLRALETLVIAYREARQALSATDPANARVYSDAARRVREAERALEGK